METIKLTQLLRRAQVELRKARYSGDVVRDAIKQIATAEDDISTVIEALRALKHSL